MAGAQMREGEGGDAAFVGSGVENFPGLGRPRAVLMSQAEKCLHTFLLIALHSGDALSAQGPVVEATGAQKSPPEPTGKQSPGPGPWIFKAPKKAGEHIEENGLWQQAQ